MRYTIPTARTTLWAALAVLLCIGLCSCASTNQPEPSKPSANKSEDTSSSPLTNPPIDPTATPKPVLEGYTVRDAKKYVISIGGDGRYFNWNKGFSDHIYIEINKHQGYYGVMYRPRSVSSYTVSFDKLVLTSDDLIKAITGHDSSSRIRIGAKKIHEIGSVSPQNFSPSRALAAIDYLQTLDDISILTAAYVYLDIASTLRGKLWGTTQCAVERALLVLRALFVPQEDVAGFLLTEFDLEIHTLRTCSQNAIKSRQFPVSMSSGVPFVVFDVSWFNESSVPAYVDHCDEHCELSEKLKRDLPVAVKETLKSIQNIDFTPKFQPHLHAAMASREEVMVQFLRCINNLSAADQELLDTVDRRGVRDNEDLMTKVREAANRLTSKEFQYDKNTHSWAIVE